MGLTLGALIAGLLGGWAAKALHVRSRQLKPLGGAAQSAADALNSVSEPAAASVAGAIGSAVDKKSV